MPITRSVWIDDDGSGTSGTVLNNAELQKIYNNIDSALVGGSGITPNVVFTGATGVVNNLACGPASVHTLIICTNTAELTITGLAFTTAPRAGDVVSIQTAGTGNVLLPHAHSGSTRKFRNYVTSAPIPLSGLYGRATYIFDHQGYFSLHNHEQGAWITPPFNAADYGYFGGNWTVGATDVITCQYRLSGRTLHVRLFVDNTTVSGSHPGLWRQMPGGFSHSSGQMFAPLCRVKDGANAVSVGLVNCNPPYPDKIIFYKDITASANWIPATDTTMISCDVALPVS